jgi:hypothetical protein
MPFFPDCYDEWGLYKITYDGDHKMYDMLFEGTEDQCRQYAYENYTDKEQGDMCLMDWEAREWECMIENPDEIVLENVKMFHLESMNERALWIGCYTQDGKIYHLNISGDQLKYYWSDETDYD